MTIASAVLVKTFLQKRRQELDPDTNIRKHPDFPRNEACTYYSYSFVDSVQSPLSFHDQGMRLYRRWKEFTETQRTTHETSLSYEREGEATAWADVPDISRRSNDDPNPKGRGKGKGKGKNKGKDEGLLEVKGKSTDQWAKSACALANQNLFEIKSFPSKLAKAGVSPGSIYLGFLAVLLDIANLITVQSTPITNPTAHISYPEP